MDLAVTTRDIAQKPKALRKEGLIPAELYGHGLKNQHLAVNAKEFMKALKAAGESTVVTLASGKEKLPVLIYNIQRHPTGGEIVHIDFYQVRMDEKLKAKVEIVFSGESPAVKNLDGILNLSTKEVEVEALPADLPHHLTVHLAALAELGQTVYVKDIAVPKGVRIMVDPETAVATVTEKRKEEEVIPAPVIDVEAVKVETEEKKSEREKEKTATETRE